MNPAGRPVPTGLAVALVAAALVPAALAVAGSVFVWLAVALDGAVLLHPLLRHLQSGPAGAGAAWLEFEDACIRHQDPSEPG